MRVGRSGSAPRAGSSGYSTLGAGTTASTRYVTPWTGSASNLLPERSAYVSWKLATISPTASAVIWPDGTSMNGVSHVWPARRPSKLRLNSTPSRSPSLICSRSPSSIDWYTLSMASAASGTSLVYALRLSESTRSELTRPSAENRPGCGGTTTSRACTLSSTAGSSMGPAAPNANML